MLRVRDIVELSDGRRGVILPTIPMLREEGPLSVIPEGQSCAVVLLPDNADGLRVVGQEVPAASFEGCVKPGGESACVFCTFTGDGFVCQRFTELHWRLALSELRAKGKPTKLFPECQRERIGG